MPKTTTKAPSTSECACGHPPLVQTPAPSDVPDAWFDQKAVDRVVKALAGLRHTKGRWARRPLLLDEWQVEHIVAPIFGWKHPDGLRIVRTAWIEIPRKNAKSTIASGLALVLLVADGELGAEVYAAAGSKDQAKIVHSAAKEMARRAPALRGKLKLLADVITVPSTGGVFRALSKVAEIAHGLNVSGAVVDEVHVHKSRDLIDAIESGEGAREQPLIIFITTADEGDEFSIYAEKHSYTRQVAAGVVKDPTHFGAIWAAAEGDDIFDEATWRKANPGLGTITSLEYMRAKAEKARTVPSYRPVFERLHLNLRRRSTVAWLPLDRWDATAGLVNDADFRDKTLFAGLDLSSTSDFTAAAILARSEPGWVCKPLFWVPEERLDELERQCNVPLAGWVKEGLLRTTEGNVVDYATVRADLKRELARLAGVPIDEASHHTSQIAYDPWNATETVQLLEGDGFVMVPIRQGYASLSGPSKELERLVLGSTPERPLFRHGGHPVLRWMVDCVEAMQDPAGNIKPAKPDRRKSAKRIDGVAAVVNTLARAMVHEDEEPGEAVFM